MQNLFIEFLPPWVETGLQPAFYDKESGTILQQVSRMYAKMNQIIKSVNDLNKYTHDTIEEYIAKFVELTEYVDNYFDNLDIQTEVDNKLDEMYENGQLADMVAQYLQLAGVLAYNTIADMAGAENLVAGSIARVLGNSSYASGDGAFYRIRALVNTDVVDGFSLVALTEAPTLVAERIPDAGLNTANSNIATLTNRVDELTNKKYLLIGDSYAEGYNPDGNVTGWPILLKSMMGLSDSECIISATGGAGFANTSHKYEDIVSAMTADPNVTDVVICGGYNDVTYTESDIFNGMSATVTNLRSKFQNLKNIYVGFIGGCTNEYHGDIHIHTMYYGNSCNTIGITYMPHLEYALYPGGLIGSDGIHPNQYGENSITRAIYAGLNGGFTYSGFYDLTIDTSQSTNFSGIDWKLHLYSENDTSYLASYEGTKILVSTTDFVYNNGDLIKLGKISQNGIVGSKYYENLQFYVGNVIIQSSTTPNGYYNVPSKIIIDKDGFVWLKPEPIVNDAHDNYQGFGGVHQIQIPMFTIIYPTNTL